MKITKKKLRKLIRESLNIQTIPQKYHYIINTIPNLSIYVQVINEFNTSIDLQSNGSIIASVTLKHLTRPNKPNDPCIPKTMSISSIFTQPDYQEFANDIAGSSGIGRLMIDLAFYYAEMQGFGITSDFDGGNSPIINHMIQKTLKTDPTYYKQTTAQGNDTMDFFNKTVDPDDDCYSDIFDAEGVYELVNDLGYTEAEAYEMLGLTGLKFPFATASSWRKRGIESIKPLWDMLTQKESEEIEDRYNVRGMEFSGAYDITPTPEEIRRREEEKRRNI
jgi:hypothetical protein